MNCRKKVELLAPAGDAMALRGALNAGADAVYLAGTSFGARAFAENFTEEALLQALSDAHLCGRKIYLTVNILTRQSELPGLVSFVRRLYDAGLDGVIVQDIGVAASLRRACPGLPLHASTQMSVMGPGAVRLLQQMGFCRVVPARELSLAELRTLKETGMEVETFIHGAMCYSCSGRCLMSSFLGGRSGNRGRCAGTCRLPFRILDEEGKEIPLIPSAAQQRGEERNLTGAEPGEAEFRSGKGEDRPEPPASHRPGAESSRLNSPLNSHWKGKSRRETYRTKERSRASSGDHGESYPLSMKDLCALPLLPELLDAGIDSFKIEGRMKKPEYAAGVTAIYRRYIDRYYEWDAQGRPGRWTVDAEDLGALQSLYIRTGLSTGYYHERNGRDMVTIGKPGYQGADPELLREIQNRYLSDRPRTAIRGRAVIRSGRPAELSVETTVCEEPSLRCCRAGGTHPGEKSIATHSPVTSESGAGAGKPESLKPSHVLPSGETGLHGADGTPEEEPSYARNPIRTLQEPAGGSTPVSFRAEGPVPQPAQQRPLTAEGIRAKLEKTGESPFRFDELDIDTDGQSFLPVSALNELRRSALDGLQEQMLRRFDRREIPQDPLWCCRICGVHPEENASPSQSDGRQAEFSDGIMDSLCRQSHPLPGGRPLTAMVMTREQAAAAVRAGADILILDGPVRDCPDSVIRLLEQRVSRPAPSDPPVTVPLLLAALPPVLRGSDLPWMEEYYYKYYIKFYGFVTRNLEEVAFLVEREYDKTVIADSALYCWNRPALESLKPWCDANILPLELDRREMERTFGHELSRMILPVYGRAPLMVSANCVRKTAGHCRQGESLFYHLKDRTGAVLPVFTDCHHCQNVIYNSVPTSLESCLSDEQDRLMHGAGALLLSFTTETGDETARIVRRFRDGSGRPAVTGPSGQNAEAQSFCQAAEPRPSGQSGAFTYGHYRKGAL